MQGELHGPEAEPPVLDSMRFRDALSLFPTGVAVVTAASDGRRGGLTVSSFNSVSLTPPLVLWSIARAAPSYALFHSAEFFCVNVLSENQAALARHFARPHRDKFAQVPHTVHRTGAPVLAECSVHLVCRTWDQFDGGDHLIIVGEVVDLAVSDRPPLVFARRHFCKLPIEHDAADPPQS